MYKNFGRNFEKNPNPAGLKSGKRKVLLLIPMFKPNYMKNARCMFESWSGSQWHPVLLSALGVFLEGKGYEVRLIDAQSYSLTEDQLRTRISEFKPDYACIWAGDQSIEEDIALEKSMNETLCPTKLIGAYLPLNQKKYGIKGIERGLENGVLDWIEGRVSGQEHIVGDHLGSDELDAMPFMSDFIHRHLDEKYYMTPSEPHPFASFFMGRGCSWGECTFCLWVHTYKKKYTRRSMKNVMSEVEYITENLSHYKSIMVEDDTITAECAREFCEMKLERGLNIKWSCYAMANLDYETMKLMKRAGCLNLHVGFESAVQRTLKKVKKGLSVKTMEQFVADSKKAGLHIHGDFMIGVDETRAEVQQTIDWACKLSVTTAQFQPFIPFFKGENDHFTRKEMTEMAQKAYMQYYGHPRHWWAAFKQLGGKPRILKESVKSLLIPRGAGKDYQFSERVEPVGIQ